ncbi:hypothetical protein FRC18_008598 [Serendipita sp. 400]|nr:hypothetical protein FRC18_008598 [Serendipita sp. 400]
MPGDGQANRSRIKSLADIDGRNVGHRAEAEEEEDEKAKGQRWRRHSNYKGARRNNITCSQRWPRCCSTRKPAPSPAAKGADSRLGAYETGHKHGVDDHEILFFITNFVHSSKGLNIITF